jgi:hypothetical protein
MRILTGRAGYIEGSGEVTCGGAVVRLTGMHKVIELISLI